MNISCCIHLLDLKAKLSRLNLLSNFICSNSSFYAIYHGPSGLTQIAKRLVELRINLESCLADLGFDIPDGIRFDSVDIYSRHSQRIHNEALKKGYNFRILPLGSTIENSTGFGISLDELSNEK